MSARFPAEIRPTPDAHIDPVARLARREDVPALAALLVDDILGREREDDRDLAPYFAAWDEMALDPNSETLVLELQGRVAAMAQLCYMRHLARKGARRCQIEAVRVASSLRGRGLGSLLLEHCFDMARARGCALVELTTDKRRVDAQRFYERLGFEAAHEGMKRTL
jgi:GNAT superfamily N-acetyltransferase